MRADDLRCFVVVADTGTLVSASEKLGISQPTLSKAMARLERAVGAELFARHARGVSLTEIGRAFLRHIRDVDVGIQDAVAAVRELRHGQAGTLRIGVGIGVPQALVAAACRSLLITGSVDLEIHGGMSDSLFRSAASGDTDFAITGVRPPGSEALAWLPLFPDPMVPIAPASHRLMGLRRISWMALARETWLVANIGTVTRAWFDRQFSDRDIEGPRCVVGLRGYPHALELGEAIKAISLVPSSTLRTVQDLRSHRELRTPADWVSDRVVGILYRPKGHLSPVAERLMKELEREARRMFG